MLKFKECLTLFECLRQSDGKGGLLESWRDLGLCYAQVIPVSMTYPLRKDSKEFYEGAAFHVTVLDDSRLFRTHRILWHDQPYFIVQTPGVTPSSMPARIPYLSFKMALDPRCPRPE
jgi:hypothetical protein